MNTPRPHPFTLVFGGMAAEKFPALREELKGNLRLEHFLMTPAAVELLRELRPDEGLGDAMDDFVAFVHAAYCYWHEGQQTEFLDAASTRGLIEIGDRRSGIGGQVAHSLITDLRSPISHYVQLPPRLIWSQVESSEIHEPIDGWFVVPEDDTLRVVACLGLHPERPGLSVITATGRAPAALSREDGSVPFAPIMDGGDVAGLHSVANADELLWLAWRERACLIG